MLAALLAIALVGAPDSTSVERDRLRAKMEWHVWVSTPGKPDTDLGWNSKTGQLITLAGWRCLGLVDVPTKSFYMWGYSAMCLRDGPDRTHALIAQLAMCTLDASGKAVQKAGGAMQVATLKEDMSDMEIGSTVFAECRASVAKKSNWTSEATAKVRDKLLLQISSTKELSIFTDEAKVSMVDCIVRRMSSQFPVGPDSVDEQEGEKIGKECGIEVAKAAASTPPAAR